MYRKYSTIRILGIMGILGAPWAFIDFMNNGLYERFKLSSWSGVRGLLFITGWMCSVMGLYLMGAIGTQRWQKIITGVQLLLLLLANCWNVIEIINPEAPVLQTILTASWPVSGVFMLVTGIVVIRVKKLSGWKRYVPLLAGLWLPQTAVLALMHTLSLPALIVTGVYATVVFILLGLCLLIDVNTETAKRRFNTGAVKRQF